MRRTCLVEGGTPARYVRPVASPYQLLERAERVEALSARIYGALARRFKGDPDARALFLRLEQEEDQHYTRVRLLAAHYRHDSKLRVEADTRELDACLAATTRALAEIEAGAWGNELGEVKRRLADLEVKVASAHAHLLASSTPPLREFFITLAQQDEEHARLLRLR